MSWVIILKLFHYMCAPHKTNIHFALYGLLETPSGCNVNTRFVVVHLLLPVIHPSLNIGGRYGPGL